MSDSFPTTLVAIAGLISTLCAVVVTGWFGLYGDSRRRKHENETRWHEKRLDLSSQLVDVARKIEEGILEAASFTDDIERDERLPGHRSVLLVPASGIPGILDEIGKEIVSEAVDAAFGSLAELGRLESKLQLMGNDAEQMATKELYSSALDAIGALESFELSRDVFGAAYELRDARQAFVEVSRAALGITRAK